MATITDSDGWVPVTRPETTDIALGGNETNFPGKFFRELASRDQYLYETALGGDATSIASAVAFRQLGIAAVAQGRLTLETGVPVSATNQTAKTILYYTPYTGDYVALYNTVELRWDLFQFTQRSLSLSGLAANTNYDIFIWDSSGTLTLQAVAWTSSGAGTSTRASSISQLNGIWVKDSDKRRYLGVIRTTATAGQCEDSMQNRLVWNIQNQARRSILYSPGGSSYTYTTAAWRAVNNNSSNRLNVVTGLGQPVQVLGGLITSGGGNPEPGGATGVGLNSSSVNSAQINTDRTLTSDQFVLYCFAVIQPVAGYNQIIHLELGSSISGTFTVLPSGGSGNYGDGLVGLWEA